MTGNNIFIFIYFYSSFNDTPVNESAVGPIGKELFEKEQDNLISDLKDIPKKACDRCVSQIHCTSYFEGVYT